MIIDKSKFVLSLEQQLLNLGYHTYQIDNIIEDSIGRHIKNLDELDETDADKVIDELKAYIDFAAKCMSKSLKL